MRVLLAALAFALLLPAVPAAPSAPALDEGWARAWLADREGVADVDLVFEGELRGLALRHFRFQQTVNGLPVEGTRAQVSVDRDGRVVHTLADVERDLEAQPCWGMRDTALAAARAQFPGALYTAPTAEHLVNHLGDTVWRVTVIPHEPLGAWRVEMRCDGEILRVWDGARYYDAKAKIFPVSPIVASGDPDFRDNPAGAGVTMSDLLVEVPLRDLEGGFLQGKYAWIMTPTATVDEGETLAFDRADPRFEDVNTYFYVDWAQRHIQSLGFDQIHNHTATIVPRVPGAYTAFYTGNPAAEMFFGWRGQAVTLLYGVEHIVVGKGGLADAGEDAHVIMHEYGHAVLDYQAGICCTEESASMHEAFGDWQAASLLTRWNNGTGDGCMAPWFGSYLNEAKTGEFPCYRNLVNDLTMADWVPGDDAHFNQLIWSGALWKTELAFMQRDGREAGAANFERVMYESNYMLPVEATLASAVQAMLVADGAINGGANRELLAAEFLARDIVTPDHLLAVPLPIVTAEAPPAGPRAIPAPAALAAVAVATLVALRRR